MVEEPIISMQTPIMMSGCLSCLSLVMLIVYPNFSEVCKEARQYKAGILINFPRVNCEDHSRPSLGKGTKAKLALYKRNCKTEWDSLADPRGLL
mmetsp:Transcript_26559/g.47711  ORF Transcript_26559/g.47711 Transcript_26559/m.47711 type:complete len:94 (+) Transcript_26559:1000-1281(+)